MSAARVVLPTAPEVSIVADSSPIRLPDGTDFLVYERVLGPERSAPGRPRGRVRSVRLLRRLASLVLPSPVGGILVLGGAPLILSCSGQTSVPQSAPAIREALPPASKPDPWPGLRRVSEKSEEVRRELREWAASRTTNGSKHRMGTASIVGEPSEVSDDRLGSEFPQCRFFELGIVSSAIREQAGESPRMGSIGHGRRVYGIVEGSEEVSDVRNPEGMGEFLRKGRIRIPSAESLGALLDRCCFGWFAPPEHRKTRVVAEGSAFLVERGLKRWRFRMDPEGRVLGVDSLR